MNAGPDFVERQGHALAREWSATCRLWAKKFATALGRSDPRLCTAFARETVAFACCLLDLRLTAISAPGRHQILKCVREEFARRQSDNGQDLAFDWRRLAGTTGEQASSEFDRLYVQCAGDPQRYGISPEVFHDFCAETGLGSNVLVGHGENLASVLFYLTLHGRGMASGQVSAERKRCLLRAGRECRAALLASIDQFIAGPAAEKTAAPPDRTPQKRKNLLS